MPVAVYEDFSESEDTGGDEGIAGDHYGSNHHEHGKRLQETSLSPPVIGHYRCGGLLKPHCFALLYSSQARLLPLPLQARENPSPKGRLSLAAGLSLSFLVWC